MEGNSKSATDDEIPAAPRTFSPPITTPPR
jgi:hypothetical protein